MVTAVIYSQTLPKPLALDVSWQLTKFNTCAVSQVSLTTPFLHFPAHMFVLVEHSRKAAQHSAHPLQCTVNVSRATEVKGGL